eukprot:tig00021013_g17053.t1
MLSDRILQSRAAELMALSKWGPAKEQLLSALRRDPSDADARTALAECLLRLADAEGALSECESLDRLVSPEDERLSRYLHTIATCTSPDVEWVGVDVFALGNANLVRFKFGCRFPPAKQRGGRARAPAVVQPDRAASESERDAEIASLRRRLAEAEGRLAAAAGREAGLSAALAERAAQSATCTELQQLREQARLRISRTAAARESDLAAADGRLKEKDAQLAELKAHLAFLQLQRESDRGAAEGLKAAFAARDEERGGELAAAAGREAGLLAQLRALQARAGL